MKKSRVLLAILTIVALSIVIAFLSNFLGGGTEKVAPVIGDRIGIVEVHGIIKDSTELVRQIVDFEKDSRIKAVIVRIDSPGGAVGPSQEIYAEIMKLKSKKPVIASIGTVGASGGYYIACAATKVIANPGTITGSIGVIIEFFNVQDLLKKIGVKENTIKSGDLKDVGSPFRDMTADEKKYLQGVIDDVHGQFIDAVAKGRNLKREEIVAIADGRIMTGKKARELKLVDELGNFNDAVDIAKKQANISGEARLVYGKKKKGFMDVLGSLSEEDAQSKLFMFLNHQRIPQYLSTLWSLTVNE